MTAPAADHAGAARRARHHARHAPRAALPHRRQPRPRRVPPGRAPARRRRARGRPGPRRDDGRRSPTRRLRARDRARPAPRAGAARHARRPRRTSTCGSRTRSTSTRHRSIRRRRHSSRICPYNVATPLIIESLHGMPTVERWAVMIQRELGDRLFAQPGTGAYGAPSVLVQLACDRIGSHRVSRTVFVPPPNVDSVLVGFRRAADWPELAPRWERITRARPRRLRHPPQDARERRRYRRLRTRAAIPSGRSRRSASTRASARRRCRRRASSRSKSCSSAAVRRCARADCGGARQSKCTARAVQLHDRSLTIPGDGWRAGTGPGEDQPPPAGRREAAGRLPRGRVAAGAGRRRRHADTGAGRADGGGLPGAGGRATRS